MSFITPEGTLSYPKVFVSELPKDPKPDDKKAWSTTILFTKDAVATGEFKALIAEAIRVAKAKWGESVGGKLEFNEKGESFLRFGEDDTLRMPFRSDVKKKGYPSEYVLFMNPRKTDDPTKSNNPRPQVVARDGREITDRQEIYPGVKARISMGAFDYTKRGNKGVSFGLNNVQKLADGPRIDNRKDASDEFDALPPLPAADMPAAGGDNLADLLA